MHPAVAPGGFAGVSTQEGLAKMLSIFLRSSSPGKCTTPI